MDEKPAQRETIDRELTAKEKDLARWILENGKPGASEFLEHLSRARVCAVCPCGCASIDFKLGGLEVPTGGLGILGDFLFGKGDELAGVFVFEQDGILAGIEVYGLAGDAPKNLPNPSELRPFE